MTIIEKIYFGLRGNSFSFKLMMKLKELGVNDYIKWFLIRGNNVNSPDEQKMNEANEFIKKNHQRIEQMLNILEDDKSRKVWKAVMKYRAKGISIPRDLWSDTDQYFAKDIIHLEDNEVFIDGGAFIGDTVQHLMNFSKKSRVKVKEVIAFEPDPENVKILQKNFMRDKRVKIIRKGLSDKEKFLCFMPNGSSGNFLNYEADNAWGVFEKCNTIKVPVTSIDTIKDCQKATFIKMDVEGSELSALMGGYQTIKKNHPKLAICIYHSLEDMVAIIEYIHKIVPEYKIYVRHHTGNHSETVMYAVI